MPNHQDTTSSKAFLLIVESRDWQGVQLARSTSYYSELLEWTRTHTGDGLRVSQQVLQPEIHCSHAVELVGQLTSTVFLIDVLWRRGDSSSTRSKCSKCSKCGSHTSVLLANENRGQFGGAE